VAVADAVLEGIGSEVLCDLLDMACERFAAFSREGIWEAEEGALLLDLSRFSSFSNAWRNSIFPGFPSYRKDITPTSSFLLLSI
jgi:hypothetical protein